MKKKEVLWIGGLLVFALLLWGGMQLFGQKESASIHIMVDGEEFGTYSLSKDQVISINDTNVCEIKDGIARMIEANCPDHLCMQFAPISKDQNGVIVCLPNQVIIEGEGIDQTKQEIDAAS
ncbi:MAG: NusG domain II-containing protein [Eubacteriales bacterium]|nr:NusG domain II-containing protein [Eubacteriales bacterium]